MKRVMLILLLACATAPLGGCIIAAGPGPGPGWIPGHYNAAGYWVRGHYA